MMFAWILILAVVLLSTKGLTRHERTPVAGNPGMDILENRYARGEINREEFLHMRNTLNSSA